MGKEREMAGHGRARGIHECTVYVFSAEIAATVVSMSAIRQERTRGEDSRVPTRSDSFFPRHVLVLE